MSSRLVFSSHQCQRERRCRQEWSRWCTRRRSPGSSCRAPQGSTLSRSCCTRSRRPETGSVQLVFIGSSDKNIQFEQGQKHGRKISFTCLRKQALFYKFFTHLTMYEQNCPVSLLQNFSNLMVTSPFLYVYKARPDRNTGCGSSS